MKILIEKSAIEGVMKRVINVVERRQTIPILANVLLEARDGRIAARVTDLDMEAVDVCPCAIDTAGSVTVEAGKLYDIVRNFPPGAQIKMEIGSDDPRFVVSSGRSRFRLPMLPVADFPSSYQADWPMSMTVDGKALLGIINRSAYAAAVNDTRYILNGVYLCADGGRLRSVAMSGLRSAYSEMEADVPAKLAVVIPAKMIAEMTRRLSDAAGDVTIHANEARVSLAIGDTVVTSKRLDGEYVDYARAIPTGSAEVLTADADALLAAIKAVMIVAANDQKVRSIRFDISPGSLVITAKDTHSDAREEIDVDYIGEPISLGLNGENAIEALAAMNADSVELEIRGAVKPMVWRPAGDTSSVAIFAPLRA